MMRNSGWQSQWRGRMICVASSSLFLALSAKAQDRVIPAVGGPGGGEFVARCPAGQVLGGVEFRAGDDIDAIRPLCRTPSIEIERETIEFGDPRYKTYETQYEDRRVIVLSDAVPTSELIGGSGGNVRKLVCEYTMPPEKGELLREYRKRLESFGRFEGQADPMIVSAMYIESEGETTVTVNRITLLCEHLTYGAPTENRKQDFWSEEDSHQPATFQAPQSEYGRGNGTSICPVSADSYATVAVGIHGRAGKWLDAVGLICEQPTPPPAPVRVVGRVRSAPGGTTATSPLPICEAARQARARNSPAAPGLEASCRNQAPVRAQSRVKLADGTTTPSTLTICEAAKQARERNSPAARGLEEQCLHPTVKAQARVRPAPGTELRPPLPICEAFQQARARNSPAAPGLEHSCLAAKGAVLTAADPLAVELRKIQGGADAQRGFDIGMAAAEGQTLPGPSKDRIGNSLQPNGQWGFKSAVAFSLERNKNAALAFAGAAIAEADSAVAKVRNRAPDVYYRLGFDIATGIYGDPALGAQPNTAPGPIRDALNDSEKLGFMDSLAYHLTRNYQR